MLPRDDGSVRAAVPARTGDRAQPLADTVELVVSELVTNAVQASVDHDGRPRYSPEHGLACIHLRLSSDGLAALIEVWDETTRPPTPVQSGLADEGGRGLLLVDALAERWGWSLPPSGRGRSCGRWWGR